MAALMNTARRLVLAPALCALALSTVSVSTLTLVDSAYALSELQKAPGQPDATGKAATDPGTPPVTQKPAAPNSDRTPGATDGSKAVEVIYDISKAPDAVRKMREQIVEAAASGDIERLRPLFGTGADRTQVTVGEPSDDPVATLKDVSGDPNGDEILAIILDIISTGFVHVGKGTPDEMYVWPYFSEKDLKTLSPPERVELLRIVTAGDLNDMQEFGGYNFYRIGITPDGKWKYLTAGD